MIGRHYYAGLGSVSPILRVLIKRYPSRVRESRHLFDSQRVLSAPSVQRQGGKTVSPLFLAHRGGYLHMRFVSRSWFSFAGRSTFWGVRVSIISIKFQFFFFFFLFFPLTVPISSSLSCLLQLALKK